MCATLHRPTETQWPRMNLAELLCCCGRSVDTGYVVVAIGRHSTTEPHRGSIVLLMPPPTVSYWRRPGIHFLPIGGLHRTVGSHPFQLIQNLISRVTEVRFKPEPTLFELLLAVRFGQVRFRVRPPEPVAHAFKPVMAMPCPGVYFYSTTLTNRGL